MESIAAVYRDRSTHFGGKARQLAPYTAIVRVGRWMVFCAAAACLGLGWPNESTRLPGSVGCGLLLGAWLVLVVLYEKLVRRHQECRVLCHVNEHSLACMDRDWQRAGLTVTDVPENKAVLASDLDLFGRASLFHLICRAGTPMGIAKLRDWLLNRAAPQVIVERQQAVSELAPELEWRQELDLRCRLLAGSPRALLGWVEGDRWLARRPWVKRSSIVLGTLPTLLVALMLTSLLPVEAGMAAVFLACVLNLVFTATFLGQIPPILRTVSSRSRETREYLALFDLIGRMPETSPALAAIKREIGGGRHGACTQLRRLHRIQLINSRSEAFKIFIFLPLQVFFLWDFHVLALLERWQTRCRSHARRWFEAAGELEALASLAALAHDNPAWVYPTIDVEGPTGVKAEDLGHPLLPEATRVANDVTVGPPGTFLLVTGSNMSGKSTLLRSLGTNVVLAQAGAPVCASQFRTSPLVLATCMQIEDSLVEGVSMFLAGLLRLKEVVDEARRPPDESDRTLMYLLDEVLLGTNAAEQRIAVETVLKHLLAERAVGVISSHDRGLATAQSLAGACVAVHFRESIQTDSPAPRMTFDYKIRPGAAPTTNALRLLELVGLGRR